VVGDFNGNGNAGIAVTNNGSLYVTYGNGDGTFQSPVTVATGGVTFIAVTSITGNGLSDLVATNPTTNNVTVLPGASAIDMTVSASHTGNFAQGQTGQTLTITANNIGAAASIGTVTVTDTLPASLTATAISGSGWTCTLSSLTCTRSDALAASSSYPPITVTVNVAANAPSSVTNAVTVAGGGETNTSNDSASDSITIGPAAVSVTVTTSPAGRTFIVDGATYTGSQTLSWAIGSSHTIGTTTLQAGSAGTQYVFNNWSDGGAASHSINVTAAVTYTANFTTQYQLTTIASPASEGYVTPASGNWYNAGTVVNLEAAWNPGYVWSGWTSTGGTLSNVNLNTATVTMNAPISVTATFIPSPDLVGALGSYTGTLGGVLTWPVTFTNSGLDAATNVQITVVTATPSPHGPQCSPVVASTLPLTAASNIPVGGTSSPVSLSINFTGCSTSALFDLRIQFQYSGTSAGAGPYAGFIEAKNQP
jgi:uncharacterized repeat protein (TIGR01451 family)/uncharacterized repeat protein (TIGR02543 family)